MRKVLVVFFSRTGNTQELAHELAIAGGWDCESLRDATRRGGILGALRSGYEALLARSAPIAPLEHDLSGYELVVVGTPVWNHAVSSPVRAFFERHRSQLRRVAFFVTCHGNGARAVLAQMARLAGREPVTTLAVRTRDVDALPFDDLEYFVDTVEHALGKQAAGPAPDSGVTPDAASP